jgi:hypothetical protein
MSHVLVIWALTAEKDKAVEDNFTSAAPSAVKNEFSSCGSPPAAS